MPNTRDIVIIGGGHNGLVTAFYLARAGYKPLILERLEQVGGCAVTEEFHPGFKSSVLAHSTGPLRPEILRELTKHGWKNIESDIAAITLLPDGRFLTLHDDYYGGKSAMGIGSARGIEKFSRKDAACYPEFCRSVYRIGKVISELLATTPPEIERPSQGDLWSMLRLGRSVRGLGKKDLYRLLRWGPMAIADLVSEFFETELLRAAIATRGIFGTALGPWSAGTSLVFLMRAAANIEPSSFASYFSAVGGIGAFTQAMAAAARKAGAEIRTRAEVIEIQIKNGVAQGVVLSTGEEIKARAVISNADPKRTFLKLTDPSLLSPTFTKRLQNYRMNGTVAKINLALDGLPSFKGVDGDREALAGPLLIAPEIDYLERAFDESKYGDFSRAPYLEILVPSLLDPTLAPEGKHVMSIYMQYAPYKLKNGTWEDQRTALGDTVVKTLAQYAPDLPGKILHHQIITPADLEETYGLTGGHIFHGELALDQVFTMRPFLDWARYRTPIENLYLCGSGTHPGIGLTGGSGANAAREILKDFKAKR